MLGPREEGFAVAVWEGPAAGAGRDGPFATALAGLFWYAPGFGVASFHARERPAPRGEGKMMRTIHRHATLIGAMTLLATAATASADIMIYGQVPVDQQASLNSQYTSGPNLRRTADDFVLVTGNTQNYHVSRINGFMHSSIGAGYPERYGMELYADAGGVPGALITTVLGASRMEDRGWAPSNMRIVEAFFDVNLTLAPDTRYWVSFFGLNGTTGQTRFSTHNYGGAAIGYTGRYLTAGGTWAPVETAAGDMYRDFAFAVYGSQMVPAPASAGVLGLAGLWASRRRRPRG